MISYKSSANAELKNYIFEKYYLGCAYLTLTIHERIKYKFMGLKKFIKVLPGNFVQVHQSIVINKNYIRSIDMNNQKIQLKGSDVLLNYGRTYKEFVEGLINESI